MANIPTHPGITEDELLESGLLAQSGVMSELFNTWYQDGCVWGAGNPATAKYLIIGEAPGWLEEYAKVPFLGPAGGILSSALKAAGISRARDCFIVNTSLMTPKKDEKGKIGKPDTFTIATEWERIHQIYKALQSRSNKLKAVVALGGFAYTQVTRHAAVQTHLTSGKAYDFGSLTISRYLGVHLPGSQNSCKEFDIPLVVAYHPAFILYNQDNQKVKEGFLAAFKYLTTL